MVQFYFFVSEKNESCCGFMNLNETFLIELQSHFFFNAKVNGFQTAKIRKKKKNGKEKIVMSEKKRTILWLDRAEKDFFFHRYVPFL